MTPAVDSVLLWQRLSYNFFDEIGNACNFHPRISEYILFPGPSRSQPPPSAESLPRFLRLQEHLELLADYLLFCKICAGFLFVVAVIRFITMVPAMPDRMQGVRKLLSHLNTAKMQAACTLCSLFTAFLIFCVVGTPNSNIRFKSIEYTQQSVMARGYYECGALLAEYTST